MSRVLELPGGGHAGVSDHALERYGQHVRPHLYGYPELLAADMRRLIAVCGTTSPHAPDWIAEDWSNAGDLWVHCGDVALLVVPSLGGCPKVIATVLTRGGISDAARSRRNGARSARTHGRRKRGKLEDKLDKGSAIRRKLPAIDPGD